MSIGYANVFNLELSEQFTGVVQRVCKRLGRGEMWMM